MPGAGVCGHINLIGAKLKGWSMGAGTTGARWVLGGDLLSEYFKACLQVLFPFDCLCPSGH